MTREVKNLTAIAGDAGDARDVASVTGSGRSPAEGHGNPLSILDWRIPWTEDPGRLIVHKITKSWTWLKWLSTHSCTLRAIAWETAFQIALRNYSKEIRKELGYIGVFAGKQTNENNMYSNTKRLLLITKDKHLKVADSQDPLCSWKLSVVLFIFKAATVSWIPPLFNNSCFSFFSIS